MSIPTHGEEYAKLTEHLRGAQESAAMLAHLRRSQASDRGSSPQSNKDHAVADGWIAVSEMMKRLQYQVIQLATGKLQ